MAALSLGCKEKAGAVPALLGLSPHFLPALAACQRASVVGQPLPRAQLCPLCLLGSAGKKSPPRCWVCQAGDKRPASPSGARFWVGRRARTPGAEIWAQPAPPPQHHRGWLTAPSSFQGVRRRKQQRTPAFFPFFPSCAPRVQTQRGFPFAPWQRQGWRQPRAPGHVYSRQEPPLSSPSEQHGPDCFLEAFQAAALAGCSACWHGHEARGRTRGRRWRPRPASTAPWGGAAKPTQSQRGSGGCSSGAEHPAPLSAGLQPQADRFS